MSDVKYITLQFCHCDRNYRFPLKQYLNYSPGILPICSTQSTHDGSDITWIRSYISAKKFHGFSLHIQENSNFTMGTKFSLYDPCLLAFLTSFPTTLCWWDHDSIILSFYLFLHAVSLELLNVLSILPRNLDLGCSLYHSVKYIHFPPPLAQSFSTISFIFILFWQLSLREIYFLSFIYSLIVVV